MTLDKKKIESDMKIKLNKLKILVNEKSGSEKRVINREIRFIEACLERDYYILGEYVNASTPIRMMCSEGHITETIRPYTFEKHGCKICWNENRSKITLNTKRNLNAKEEFFNMAEYNGYKVIGEYINSNSPIEIQCPSGHITNTLTPSHFKSGTRCRICYKMNRNSDVDIEIGKIYEQNKGSRIKVLELCNIETNDGKRAGFKYKCCVEKCQYEGTMRISSFKNGHGCASCNGSEIVIGYNDVNTTHPDLVDNYFKNKEDGKKYKANSWQKVPIICPDCSTEMYIEVGKLTRQKFTCYSCGDGLSIQYKIMFNVFVQLLEYKFETEDSPKWIGNRIFDFSFNKEDLPQKYIENLPIKYHNINTFRVDIDEVLGHGKYNTLNRVISKERIEIDYIKDKKALENNNYVIRIGYRYNDEDPLESIINSIVNSELSEIFNIDWENDIDWNSCIKFSKSSRVIEVINLYNDGNEVVTDLMNITKISRGTIIAYLKLGDKLNLCYYPKVENNGVCCLGKLDVKNSQKKGLLYTQKEWEDKSVEIFGEKLLSSHISSVINGKRNHHKKYIFKRYTDLTIDEKYDLEVINDFDKLLYDENIKIYCKEKNVELNMKEWLEKGSSILGIDKVIGECITRVITKERKYYRDFHFEIR